MYSRGGKDQRFPLSKEDGLAFIKSFDAGINPVCFWAMPCTEPADSPVPGGLYNLREVEWDLAAIAGSAVKAQIQLHVDKAPEWFFAQHPDEASAIAPAYSPMPEALGAHIINPDSVSMMEEIERYVQFVINRYKANPNVKGFLIGAGVGQVEMALELTGLRYGHAPSEQEGFRAWLRTQQRLSLSDLGERWFGDRNHFRSWQDVEVPSPHEFFGWAGSIRIPLTKNLSAADRGEFLVRSGPLAMPAEIASLWRETAFGGISTVALPAVLDQKQFQLGNTWMQRTFILTAAQLAALRREGGWLYGQYEVQVILNGTDLGVLSGKSTKLAEGQPGSIEHCYPFDPFGVRVEQLLREGENIIVLRPVGTSILTPFFISDDPPRRYPFLGAHRNARYVDWITWAYARVARMHERLYKLARENAPQAQLTIFAPAGGLLDAGGEIAGRYNARVRNTGAGAFYFPWYAHTGAAAGYSGSAEPSDSITDPFILRRMLGWSFFDNDEELAFFWDVSSYASPANPAHEEFIRSKRLLGLFARSHPESPSLAFLYPSRQFQFEILQQHPVPFEWDPGRGEIQSAGIDFGYVTESLLARGLPSKIGVLMDTGTAAMEPQVLANLEKWVRQGGTFIALHQTGRHGLIEADTWPINVLTGFEVTGFIDKQESIRFETGQKLWPSLSGRTTNGRGVGEDFLGQNFVGTGVRLKQTDSECEVIARWSDGGVAIGQRRVGRGRVIVLGSTFWRNARDLQGIYTSIGAHEQSWLLELYSGLGVPLLVSSPGLFAPWVREATASDTGKRWLIVFNPTDRAMAGASVDWRRANGRQVRDLAAADEVESVAADANTTAVLPHWVRIAPVAPLVNFSDQGPHAYRPHAEIVHEKALLDGIMRDVVSVPRWVESGIDFQGAFNLAVHHPGERVSLSFPLRGNGSPITFGVWLYDSNGGYRYYLKAGGLTLSINGREWLTCRIDLNKDGPDFGNEHPAPNGKPFSMERVVRIALHSLDGWEERFANSPKLERVLGLVSFGEPVVEREALTTGRNPGLTVGDGGRLFFDLAPFQIRVLEVR